MTAYEEVRQEWQVLDSQRLQVISQDVDDVRRRLSEREAHDEEIQRQLRGKCCPQSIEVTSMLLMLIFESSREDGPIASDGSHSHFRTG